MKSAVLTIFKLNLFLLFIFVSANIQARHTTQRIEAEPYSSEIVQGEQMSIQFVNSKLIKVLGKEYAIGAKTVILDKQGKKLSVSALKKGMSVRIKFNDKQRFISRPTLSHIYVD